MCTQEREHTVHVGQATLSPTPSAAAALASPALAASAIPSSAATTTPIQALSSEALRHRPVLVLVRQR